MLPLSASSRVGFVSSQICIDLILRNCRNSFREGKCEQSKNTNPSGRSRNSPKSKKTDHA